MSSKDNNCITVRETTWLDISVPPVLKREFKTMVQRSMNTWQDASPEIRKFADKILGREEVMQSSYKVESIDNSCKHESCGIVCEQSETPETEGLKQSNIAILRGCTWDCHWPEGCSDTQRCLAFGGCAAKAQSKF